MPPLALLLVLLIPGFFGAKADAADLQIVTPGTVSRPRPKPNCTITIDTSTDSGLKKERVFKIYAQTEEACSKRAQFHRAGIPLAGPVQRTVRYQWKKSATDRF